MVNLTQHNAPCQAELSESALESEKDHQNIYCAASESDAKS